MGLKAFGPAWAGEADPEHSRKAGASQRRVSFGVGSARTYLYPITLSVILGFPFLFAVVWTRGTIRGSARRCRRSACRVCGRSGRYGWVGCPVAVRQSRPGRVSRDGRGGRRPAVMRLARFLRASRSAHCALICCGVRELRTAGGGDSCLQIRGMPGFGSDVGSHSSPAVMRGGCGASTTPTACSNPASWRRRAPRRHARAGARSDKGSQRRNHIESREARSHEDAGRAVT